MSVHWSGDLREGLAKFATEVHRDIEPALAEGAQVVLADSNERVPKESTDLERSGHVAEHRGGTNTVAVVYSSVYARWQHEHLWFAHPHGGQPKFLETALLVKGREAFRIAGERLWHRG